MEAERKVRVSRVILEDAAVSPGATVDSQTGVNVPADQRLCLRLLVWTFTQTGAAGAELPQNKLANT